MHKFFKLVNKKILILFPLKNTKILPASLTDIRHLKVLTNTQQRKRPSQQLVPPHNIFPELHHLFFTAAHLHATPVSQQQSNARTRKTNFNCRVITIIGASHFKHGRSLNCSHKKGNEASTEKKGRKLGSISHQKPLECLQSPVRGQKKDPL